MNHGQKRQKSLQSANLLGEFFQSIYIKTPNQESAAADRDEILPPTIDQTAVAELVIEPTAVHCTEVYICLPCLHLS